MNCQSVTHIALGVGDLQKAEALYRNLFRLKVAFREAETSDGWRTLPQDKSWADAQAAGIELDMVMLHRDGLVLALAKTDTLAIGGTPDHIGLQVDEEELVRLRKQAANLECELVGDHPKGFILHDPLRVRWEITTTPYNDPPSLSNGARKGRWLKLQD
ncbi:MAG: VOC family protein [Planctomycetes bacterium]|nr:VOC family protein [Planctomycetota bacterium]